MFIRIVKMSFHEENIPKFLENFDSIKEKIRGAAGNRFLELYQDKNNPSIFFTYSYWESENDLENYRKSAFFDGHHAGSPAVLQHAGTRERGGERVLEGGGP
jgi:heme-degrading monooxygenase HmoA